MTFSLETLENDMFTINNSVYNNFPINLNFRDDFEENGNNTNIYDKYICSWIKNNEKDDLKILNSSIFNIFREYVCNLDMYKDDNKRYYSYGNVIKQIKEWILSNNPKLKSESDNKYKKRIISIFHNPNSITLRYFPKASYTGRLLRAYSKSLPNDKKPNFFIINGMLNSFNVSRFDYIGLFSCESTKNSEYTILDKYLFNGNGNGNKLKNFLSFANNPKNLKYNNIDKNDFIRDVSKIRGNADVARNSIIQNESIDLYISLIDRNTNKRQLFENKKLDIYSVNGEFIKNYSIFTGKNLSESEVKHIIDEEHQDEIKNKRKKKRKKVEHDKKIIEEFEKNRVISMIDEANKKISKSKNNVLNTTAKERKKARKRKRKVYRIFNGSSY